MGKQPWFYSVVVGNIKWKVTIVSGVIVYLIGTFSLPDDVTTQTSRPACLLALFCH